MSTLRFREYLSELFDNPVKYSEYEYIEGKHESYHFTSGIGYLVTFIHDDEDSLVIDGLENSDKEMVADIEKNGNWDLSFMATGTKGKPMGILGGKDSVEIFSTVMKIIKDFAKRHKGEILTFSADEPSRKKLYDAFVKTYAGKYHIVKDGSRSIYVVRL